MTTVNIAGLDKAQLLMRLYNHSRPMGMGMLQARPDMTIEEATKALANGDDLSRMFGNNSGLYFDYLFGRPLKINIGGDELSTAMYNRDNGQGAAEKIVEAIRAETA